MKIAICRLLINISDELDQKKLYRFADQVMDIATEMDPFDWGDHPKMKTIERPDKSSKGDLGAWLNPEESIDPLYNKSFQERKDGAQDIIGSIFGSEELKKAVSTEDPRMIRAVAADISQSLKQKYGIPFKIKVSETMREYCAKEEGRDGILIALSPETLFANHGLDKLEMWIDAMLLKIKKRMQNVPETMDWQQFTEGDRRLLN